eukprot:2596943-Rhodomonas_salina.1
MVAAQLEEAAREAEAHADALPLFQVPRPLLAYALAMQSQSPVAAYVVAIRSPVAAYALATQIPVAAYTLAGRRAG